MARRNDHTREELVSMTLEQVKNFLADHPHHALSLRKVAAMIGYVPSTSSTYSATTTSYSCTLSPKHWMNFLLRPKLKWPMPPLQKMPFASWPTAT